MRPGLLEERDTSARPPLAGADDLADDLELDVLWDAGGNGDAIARSALQDTMLRPLTDADTIRWRQEATADVDAHRAEVVRLAEIAAGAAQVDSGILGMRTRGHPESTLSSAVRTLEGLTAVIEELRAQCAGIEAGFSSRAFRAFFAEVRSQLDADYVAELRERLHELAFAHGLLFSARIGTGGRLTDLTLRRSLERNRHLLSGIPLRRPFESFALPDRDEAGQNRLGELRERAIERVADAAAQSADHVQAYFARLRYELAFHLGACALRDALGRNGVSTCDGVEGETTLARGLVDPALALRWGRAPVANDVDLRQAHLLVVTGANHGGKSTFLRALGSAQLLFQAGLQVPSAAFAAPLHAAVHTHWEREEDGGLEHGKLDDELTRMSAIVDRIRSGDLVLMNESFASTNEAEGSQLAADVVVALVRAGVEIRFVTHLWEFARTIRDDAGIPAEFLRASRDAAGERSYRLERAGPLPTSYGADLWARRFGAPPTSRSGS